MDDPIIKIMFRSSKVTGDVLEIHSQSNNEGIIIAKKLILLKSSMEQRFLESKRFRKKMKGSYCGFDYVELLNHYFYRTSLNRGGSYTDPFDWLRKKKSYNKFKNEDEKIFSVYINHHTKV